MVSPVILRDPINWSLAPMDGWMDWLLRCLLGSINSKVVWSTEKHLYTHTKELFWAISGLSDSNSGDIISPPPTLCSGHHPSPAWPFHSFAVRAWLYSFSMKPMFAAETINGDARHTIYFFHLINAQINPRALYVDGGPFQLAARTVQFI